MKYKFSDSVICRIVQILQEAMLTGTDIVDIFRLFEVTPDGATGQLVMTPEYEDLVKKWHTQLLDKAAEIQAERAANEKSTTLIVG